MIADILKKIHRKYAKDLDYPVTGSEEVMVRLDHVDDAISEWEDLTKEGFNWKELMTSGVFIFAGTGSDVAPANFLSFIHNFGNDGYEMAQLQIGNAVYLEVKASEGSNMKMGNYAPYIFWQEGANIMTLPAALGTITMPYLKKATRYVTGEETTEPEMENPKFIEDYATAKVFLDNKNSTMYTANMTQANEKLKQMKYNALA